MNARMTTLLSAGMLAGSSGLASAHLQLSVPKQRYADLKDGPCGITSGTRTENVCELRPGATITLVWEETIEHPGHFRISFDDDGDNDFVDPDGYDDLYSGPSVLLDDIADRDVDQDGDPVYTQELVLPDVECDNCTLQVIQVMTDKPPYGDGNDLYYQCADLVLSSAAPAEPAAGCTLPGGGGADAGPDPDAGASGGCSAAGSGGTGGTGCLIAILLAAVAITRGSRAGGRCCRNPRASSTPNMRRADAGIVPFMGSYSRRVCLILAIMASFALSGCLVHGHGHGHGHRASHSKGKHHSKPAKHHKRRH